MGTPLVYRCSPTILWVKDAEQTLLVDEDKQQSWSLRGLDAAIWDLLALGYSFERMIPFLSLLQGCPGAEFSREPARKLLLATLQRWIEAGMVQIGSEQGNAGPSSDEQTLPNLMIDRTELEPEPSLLDNTRLSLFSESGSQRTLRLRMFLPGLPGKGRTIHPNQYRAMAAKIVELVRVTPGAGMNLELGCGFVRCTFSRQDLEVLEGTGLESRWLCEPIPNRNGEEDASVCPPLAAVLVGRHAAASAAAPAGAGHGHLGRAEHAEVQAFLRLYRQAGVFPECSSCRFKIEGECPGGCLAATIRRFRATPFRFQIPDQISDPREGRR